MAKIAATVIAAITVLIVIIAAAVAGVVSAVLGGGNSSGESPPSPAALADIPGDYLALYLHAATVCPGLDWSILAAIGKVETNHGRLEAPGVHSGANPWGAAGPMQFLAPTFVAVTVKHPIPPGGNTPPSRYNPHDAIHAAAFYLCDNGAREGRDLYGAIYAYNHADWYVRNVLDQARKYRAAQPQAPASGSWIVPVQGRCSSGFGPRDGDFHEGQDIAAPIGTPIVAAGSGTVIDSGPASGFGLWVRIQHPGGVVTVYGHNNRNLVHAGQQVQAGHPIAEVGNRGESTGPHVHFQIETGGHAIDPVAFYHQQSAPPLCN